MTSQTHSYNHLLMFVMKKITLSFSDKLIRSKKEELYFFLIKLQIELAQVKDKSSQSQEIPIPNFIYKLEIKIFILKFSLNFFFELHFCPLLGEL